MIRINNIKAPVGFSDGWLRQQAAKKLGVPQKELSSVRLLKKSLDARRKHNIHYVLSVGVETGQEALLLQKFAGDSSIQQVELFEAPQVVQRRFVHPPVVVGSGPAGLFAALHLANAGARPLLVERGGNVDERQATVRRFWDGGAFDPECNVQFGEGGAGTFSDGKLTTGTKDPRIREVLQQLQLHGAPDDILYEAKPHIGTDLLAETVKNIRLEIIRLGGQVEFHARFVDYREKDGAITHAIYQQKGVTHTVETGHIVLATGHSARDVFQLLHEKDAALEQKAFSVGVRIEHLQQDIDNAMYGDFEKKHLLPAADYKLAVHLPSGRSVYTFCMCPGGFVVASSSEKDSVVTNGMSLHARDGVNANSALLVGVGPGDFGSAHPLAGVEFQRKIEQDAFRLSGSYAAPACTVGDFLKQAAPVHFGKVIPTYQPGTVFALPDAYLPGFVCDAMREGLGMMGRRIRGFDSRDALLTGPETRSSSPVRILRAGGGHSLRTLGLYPCGEGAGYAGGIVSAAVDGIRTAEHILADA